ncbi:hypothetical protein T10_13397 [Trichinella papuae]|uniref:Uncharacterized protein n=1 Tax=Trichinella papuae TaxID=268474 RepID=A0A0V1MFN7_9BILA|nr:hypothetical protein T10_13397 [Trichinella papuae]
MEAACQSTKAAEKFHENFKIKDFLLKEGKDVVYDTFHIITTANTDQETVAWTNTRKLNVKAMDGPPKGHNLNRSLVCVISLDVHIVVRLFRHS